MNSHSEQMNNIYVSGVGRGTVVMCELVSIWQYFVPLKFSINLLLGRIKT